MAYMHLLGRCVRILALVAAACFLPMLYAQQQVPAEQEKNAEQYLLSLKTGTMCERRAAITGLFQMGKAAIPILIDRIGDKEIAKSSTLMLANPALSYAPPGSQRDAYSGVLYAYVIELILARESLHSSSGDCMFLLDHSDYAYGHGLIMKGPNVIRDSELSRVKQLYSQWWETHRNEDLITLRRDWQKSRRPLAGSAYQWL